MGNILGPIAGAATTFGLGKLFGGSQSKSISALSKAPPVSVNAGGLSGSGGSITASPERMALVNRLSATFPELAAQIGDLRSRVKPGFGALTESAVQSVNNARQRAVGNLRENLARRRVLGSSFGEDALARVHAEFGQEERRVRAESFTQELDLTNRLLTAEFEAKRGEFQTLLDEYNIQANAGVQLASGAQAQLGANQRIQAQLAALSLTGLGKSFEPIVSGVSKQVASIFEPAAA